MAKIVRYSKLLAKRIYRPVKPVVNPLLKKIKLVYWLIALVIIAIIGNWQYWEDKKAFQAAQEKKIATETEIRAWENLLKERPESKDIYMKLALLNTRINNQEQAKSNWERASYLDPNNKEVQDVGRIIFPVLLF